MSAQPTSKIIGFLRDIGLKVIERPIPESTILPGITVDRGDLVLDHARLQFPTDLLHEGGHLAVVPACERVLLNDNVGNDGGMEMGAIAWSYAAALHLEIPPESLFHDGGYRGNSIALIENFGQGRYIGVPILVWRGLTGNPNAASSEAPGFPAMKKWLAD